VVFALDKSDANPGTPKRGGGEEEVRGFIDTKSGIVLGGGRGWLRRGGEGGRDTGRKKDRAIQILYKCGMTRIVTTITKEK
jgi:hypothetical protein